MRECYQAMPLETVAEKDCLNTDVGHNNNIRFATLTSSELSAFAFHFFDAIYVLKYPIMHDK